MSIRTTIPIIPKKQTFTWLDESKELDLKAICAFVAVGFFLDQDTYYKNCKVLKPGHNYDLSKDSGKVLQESSYFKWNYNPRNLSFEQALDEYMSLFRSIIKEQSQGDVILPLSGGLDSRTQALALKENDINVKAFGYEFAKGYPETKIANKVAEHCGFDFDKLIIPEGYLWYKIDDIYEINQGYSDFCSPRQVAILESLKNFKGQFSLGHWGDVLFDRGVAKDDEDKDDLDIIRKKLLKSSGCLLANALWNYWNIEGEFNDYINERFRTMLNTIDITNKSARIRAFKSMYWAPRWTSVNLAFFESLHPINLPYYDDRICNFICGVPEEYLADRRLQIGYIKKTMPQLAKLTWDLYHPFNLYNHQKFHKFSGIPYRAANSLKYRTKLMLGKSTTQRNWELQLTGTENDKHLRRYLFSKAFQEFCGAETLKLIYNAFKIDKSRSAHAINMLLTLSVWYHKQKTKKVSI